MNLDFLEIGTSDFNTCVQVCPDDAVGISIEPIKQYLDKLPNKPFVKKINCAISFDNTESVVDVLYIPEDVIKANDLPEWYKGCNTIGDYHYAHVHNKLTHLVVRESVPSIPISKILTENDVVRIKFLKVDVEGKDCYIMDSLLEYLQDKPFHYYPDRILFESNLLSSQEHIQRTKQQWLSVGYLEEKYDINNTMLVKL